MATVCGILVVVMLLGAGTASASPASVNIYNFIPGGTVLVNCGGRVGSKTLQYGEHLGWGFQPNIWGTTTFACSFTWGAKSQHFEVWVDEGIFKPPLPFRRCVQCVWRIDVDGFYVAEYNNPPSHQYNWIG